MFTTKHYRTIANFIAIINIPKKHKIKLIKEFIVLFSRDNKNFKPNFFEKACGGE